MDRLKVSKQGKYRVVFLPAARYAYQDEVVVKPADKDIKLYLSVSRSGRHLLVYIPLKHRDTFGHHSDVMVRRE
jgi:hypothetical protein